MYKKFYAQGQTLIGGVWQVQLTTAQIPYPLDWVWGLNFYFLSLQPSRQKSKPMNNYDMYIS